MRRSTLKFRQDEIMDRIVPLLNVARLNLIYIEPPEFSFVSDQTLRNQLRKATWLLGRTLTAFLQLHSVYEETIITFRMSRRFPWRKGEIKKSQHLSLVWFQFINQCYLFKEKTKLFANCYNEAVKFLGHKEESIDVTAKLKLINKEIGNQIRVRGESFHEWYVAHTNVQRFAAIEIINSSKRIEGPLGNVEGHYSDAKFFLSSDIKQAIVFMENHLIATLDDNFKFFIRLIDGYNTTLQELSGEIPGAARTEN
jgi:hypothetical protein